MSIIEQFSGALIFISKFSTSSEGKSHFISWQAPKMVEILTGGRKQNRLFDPCSNFMEKKALHKKLLEQRSRTMISQNVTVVKFLLSWSKVLSSSQLLRLKFVVRRQQF